MVAIDMCGKNPITGEWIYEITWKHVFFNKFVLFIEDTTSILKLVFPTIVFPICTLMFTLVAVLLRLMLLLLLLLLFIFLYFFIYLSCFFVFLFTYLFFHYSFCRFDCYSYFCCCHHYCCFCCWSHRSLLCVLVYCCS